MYQSDSPGVVRVALHAAVSDNGTDMYVSANGVCDCGQGMSDMDESDRQTHHKHKALMFSRINILSNSHKIYN